MSASILAHFALGYRYLWNLQRRPAAIELFIDTAPDVVGVDARHLLDLLSDLWPARAPQLLLNSRSPALLRDLLAHAPADGPWIVLPQPLWHDANVSQRAQQAHARGVSLVWQGSRGQQPDPDLTPPYRLSMVSFNEAQALRALQILRSQLQNATGAPEPDSPLPAGQVLLAPPSRLLTDWALDRQSAWAVAGWPVDDILQPGRFSAVPARDVVTQLVRAIEDDASLERLEQQFNAEPLLAYRFLCHVNGIDHKLRGQIDTVRQGLMVWGLKNVQSWLLAQLARAGDDIDLRPVRLQLRVRASLVEHILDPGDEEELRRELYLCGLLSEMDRLLGEPMPAVLERLPLSQRIQQALLENSGPYHPALQMARALEAADPRAVHLLCENYGLDPEGVNRALLRTLAHALS